MHSSRLCVAAQLETESITSFPDRGEGRRGEKKGVRKTGRGEETSGKARRGEVRMGRKEGKERKTRERKQAEKWRVPAAEVSLSSSLPQEVSCF